jgi:hypothetical protein
MTVSRSHIMLRHYASTSNLEVYLLICFDVRCIFNLEGKLAGVLTASVLSEQGGRQCQYTSLLSP